MKARARSLERPIEGTDLASRLFGRSHEHTLALLRAAWPVAVGAELAWRTEVLALEGRTLRVRVPDGAWRDVLHRMRGSILKRLEATAGSLTPTAIGYHEGPITPRASAPPEAKPVQTHPNVPTAVAEAAQAIKDPEIRAGFEQTAARYLARQGDERGNR